MGHFEIINNKVYLRLLTNSTAIILFGVFLLLLFNQKHKQFRELPSIKWEKIETDIIKAKPEIPENYIPPKPIETKGLATQNPTNDLRDILPNLNNIKKDGLVNHGNSNKNNQNIPTNIGSSKTNPTLPKLSNSSQNTIISTECLTKIDSEDRPKNCPPNDVARKLIQAARAPKYRPEMVDGLSKAEINSRYYAGVRDKCQKDDGGKYMVCVPIGKKPPRVKTPYELCIEMGLGGCTRPARPDGSKDASFNYGNE